MKRKMVSIRFKRDELTININAEIKPVNLTNLFDQLYMICKNLVTTEDTIESIYFYEEEENDYS